MKLSLRWFVTAGLLVALILGVWVSRYASSQPDGLERVAIDHRLDADEKPHHLARSPLADYGVAGVSGLVGVVVVFVAAGGVTLAVSRIRRGHETPS